MTRLPLDVLLAHLPAPLRQSRLARPGALCTPRAATTLFVLACVALSLSVVFLWWANGLRESRLAELQRLRAELSAPPPAAPPMNYRFLGRMSHTAPELLVSLMGRPALRPIARTTQPPITASIPTCCAQSPIPGGARGTRRPWVPVSSRGVLVA